MKIKRVLLCLFFLQMVSITQAQNLKVFVNNKGKIGFVNSQGKEIVKCLYDNALPFNDGVAIVSKSDKFGLLDINGNLILPVKYSQISLWAKDMYLIKSGKKMGLCNSKGEIVLPVKYSHISKLNTYGKALIALGGKATKSEDGTYMANAKYGIIDAHGKILINPLYKGLYEFSFDAEGGALYEGKRLAYSYHYTKDTLITDCSYMGFSKNPLSIFKAGLIDANGQILLAPNIYNTIMEPRGDMMRYYISKKKKTICGYYNIKTKESFNVAEFNSPYEKIEFWTHGEFNGDIAPVNGATWSFIDKKGNVLRSGYNSIKHSLNCSLWAAKTTAGTWDVFDEQNNIISHLSGFLSIDFPLNKTDKEIFNVNKEGKFGCVNRNGDVIIPFEYDNVLKNSFDLVSVKKNGKWGVLSTDNEIVIPIEYEDVTLPIMYGQKHFWVKRIDGLYYHYNLITNQLSVVGYKNVTNFKDGFSFVTPPSIKVVDNQVNNSQYFSPNTPITTIKKFNKSESKMNFGYVIDENDNYVFDLPVSEIYYEAIKSELTKLDGRIPTASEKKRILLEVTKTNRSYGLNSIISEDDWDY